MIEFEKLNNKMVVFSYQTGPIMGTEGGEEASPSACTGMATYDIVHIAFASRSVHLRCLS